MRKYANVQNTMKKTTRFTGGFFYIYRNEIRLYDISFYVYYNYRL